MAEQQELTGIDVKTDYLALPAGQLLDAYGGGSHIPGSGSAAAFSALIGIEMMRGNISKLSTHSMNMGIDSSSLRMTWLESFIQQN
ncbi:MAG: hypothetical protein ACKVRN_14990 [Pyrinomonadaceae bacterium]